MMWWTIVGCLSVVLVWKIAQSFSANKFLEEISTGLSRDEAEKQMHECFDIVLMRHKLGSASGISRRDANARLERAVWMQDRMNELDGLPHGPAARLKIRATYLETLKSV